MGREKRSSGVWGKGVCARETFRGTWQILSVGFLKYGLCWTYGPKIAVFHPAKKTYVGVGGFQATFG
jgi:hypothetical protein